MSSVLVPQVRVCKLQVASCILQAEISKLQVKTCKLQVYYAYLSVCGAQAQVDVGVPGVVVVADLR